MSRSHTSNRTDTQPREIAFELLRNRRRRHVLAFLSDRRSAVTLDEIADAVASGVSPTGFDEPSAEFRTRVAATLHHVHLPKLADAGVVSYDTEAKTVTPERMEVVAPYVADERNGSSSRCDGDRS